jgi:hypothetical protein
MLGAYFEIVPSSGPLIFSDASTDDVILRTAKPDNRFLFGNGSNVDATLSLIGNQVGVGTADPTARLHVYHKESGMGPLFLAQDATSFIITDTGNVGIGLTEPTSQLHIEGNQYLSGTLTIGGDLVVQGSNTIVNTENVRVEDNIITVNANQSDSPLPGLVSGIEVERGDLANYLFVFEEATNLFKVGTDNNLQAVATRLDTVQDRTVPIWDAGSSRYIYDSNIVILPSGSVGIGTTHPLHALHVEGGSTHVNGELSVSGTSTFESDLLKKSGASADIGSSASPFNDAYITTLKTFEEASFESNVTIDGPRFLVPRMDTTTRCNTIPSPVDGLVIYNTSTKSFEGYAADAWGSLGGVKDVDGDTFISAEDAPNANNNQLRFFTSNVERMTIQTDGSIDIQGDVRGDADVVVAGSIGVGTSTPQHRLDIGANTLQDEVVRVVSQRFAGIVVEGDSVNASGEPGGSYMQLMIDGGSTVGGVSMLQGIGQDGLGGAYTGTRINAMLVGTFTNSPLQFGTHTHVRMTILPNGNIGIGSTNPRANLDVDGTLVTTGLTQLTNTTDSTSKDTGALVVTGGVGIGSNVNVGGDANITGTSTLMGATTINNTLTVTNRTLVTDTTESTSTTTGAMTVSGGMGIGSNVNVGGNVNISGTPLSGIPPEPSLNVEQGFVSFNNGYLSLNNAEWTIPDGTKGEAETVMYMINKAGVMVTGLGANGDGTIFSQKELDIVTGDRLCIFTGTTSTTGTPAMVIANNGFVGIGLLEGTPQASLDITGGLRCTGASLFDNTLTVSEGCSVKTLVVQDFMTVGEITSSGECVFSGNVGIGSQSPTAKLEVNGTLKVQDEAFFASNVTITGPSFLVPRMSTTTRNNVLSPAQDGMVIYNTFTKSFEGFTADAWGSLGGVKDVDGDTFISAEDAPNSNNNQLRFFTSNVERMTIESGGAVGVAQSLSISTLTGDRVLISDANKNIVSSGITTVELGRLSGIASNVQQQLDTRVTFNQMNWFQGSPAPSIIFPTGGAFTTNDARAIYRFAGNEVVYNIFISGTIDTQPSDVGEDVQVTLQFPVDTDTYTNDTILGDLWLTIQYNGVTTTYKAYARSTTTDENRAVIRYLSLSADRSLSILSATSTITLQGSIVYKSSQSTTIIDDQIEIPSAFRQDIQGRVVLNGDGVTPPRGRLDIIEAGNFPALLLEQQSVNDILRVVTSDKAVGFVIDGNGNVGIGVTQPSEKIHVGGGGTIRIPSLTSNRVLEMDATNNLSTSTVTTTELSYLQGATSNIQPQLDSKVPFNQMDWYQGDTPTLSFPSSGLFTASSQNRALYRFAGNEVMYHVIITGTLVEQPTDPSDDVELILEYPVSEDAYSMESIIGDLWLTVTSQSGMTTTYKAYAKTTTSNASRATLRFLSVTVDNALSSIGAPSTLTLQGTLIYKSSSDSFIEPLPYTALPTDFMQDGNGRVILNGGGSQPRARLDVNEAGSVPALLLEHTGTTGADIFKVLRSGTTEFAIDQNGNVGIGLASPTQKLHVQGNILASGSVTQASDRRIKDNIQTIEGALSIVEQMRGVFFNVGTESKRQVGLVAQEVEEVLPEAVFTNDTPEAIKSVAYGNIVGLLCEAIKEMKQDYDTKLSTLETQLHVLRNEA